MSHPNEGQTSKKHFPVSSEFIFSPLLFRVRKCRSRKKDLQSSNLQTRVTETSVQEQPSPQGSLSPTSPSTTAQSQASDATYVSSSLSEPWSLMKTSITTQTGSPFAIVSPAKNKRLSQVQIKRLRQNKYRIKKSLHTDPEVRSYALAGIVAETLREGESCDSMAEALSGYTNVKAVLTAKNNKTHELQIQTIRRITRHYVNMLMYRNSGRFSKADQEADILKANYSLSQIGEAVSRSKSEVHRLLNCTYNQPKRGTTDEQKQIVTDFIKNDSLVALAGRRFQNVRYMNHTYSKSYTSYRAHLVVSESKTKPVGLTTYYNLLRKAQTTDAGKKMRIRPRSKIPWIDAQCMKCVNMNLCTNSLRANGVQVSNRTTVNLAATVCPFYIPRKLFEELLRQNGTVSPVETPILPRPSRPREKTSTKKKARPVRFADRKADPNRLEPHKDPALWVQINLTTLQHVPDLDLSHLTTYADTQCLLRECLHCGIWMLDQMFDRHRHRFMKKVGVEMWGSHHDEQSIHPCRKQTQVSPLRNVINDFKLLLDFSAKHLLILKWQQEQFSIRVNDLLPGEVLTVMDYAMNIELQEQENTSESHFNRHNFTVGVFVAFFKCSQGCDQLRKHDFIMLTSRHSKDQHSTFMMTKKYLQEMQKENMICGGKVTSLTEFCDNCAGQFKSSLTALYMSRLGIPVTRMFFAARHGKGIADAAIASFKSILYNSCKTGETRPRTEHDVIKFFQIDKKEKETSQHLSKVLFPNRKHKRSYCQHSDRSCHFVNGAWIEALKKQNPLEEVAMFQGIRSAHAFRYDPKNDEKGEDTSDEEWEDEEIFPVVQHRNLHCVCRSGHTH